MNYTDISQSKQLVEAGLDPKTADMFYLRNENHIHIGDYDDRMQYEKNWDTWPSWSLGALVSLLPNVIETKKPKNLYFPEILPASNGVAYTALNGNKEMVFLKMFTTGVESDATLIDNMVSMICWLLENNYIKKGNVK